MNLYEVLGVPPGASPDDLRHAYRARARALHPDRHPDDAAAEEAMRVVNAAWAVLSDPARRAAYDRRLAGWDPPDDDGGAERVEAHVTPEGRTADLLLGLMRRHRPLRAGLALFLLVVLFAIFVVTAYAGGGGGTR